MAKLNKQKFNNVGFHREERTTSSSNIELYLYYNTEDEYFYFDIIELLKYFKKEDLPNTKSYFGKCDSKEKAINAMKALIVKGGKETKYLRIMIGMPDMHWKIANPEKNERGSYSYEKYISDPNIPPYLADMLKRGKTHSDTSSGLTIDFTKVIKIEQNNSIHFVECNKEWGYRESSLSGNGDNLIEWTQEREDFIINAQNKLNNLCMSVLNYFNAGDDVNKLFERMESNNNLLDIGK